MSKTPMTTHERLEEIQEEISDIFTQASKDNEYFGKDGWYELHTPTVRQQILALIESAKREGAIEELQMIPKEGYYGDEGTAVEYVKNRIAQLKQSEESE